MIIKNKISKLCRFCRHIRQFRIDDVVFLSCVYAILLFSLFAGRRTQKKVLLFPFLFIFQKDENAIRRIFVFFSVLKERSRKRRKRAKRRKDKRMKREITFCSAPFFRVFSKCFPKRRKVVSWRRFSFFFLYSEKGKRRNESIRSKTDKKGKNKGWERKQEE